MKKTLSLFFLVISLSFWISSVFAQSFSDLNLKFPFPAPETWKVSCAYKDTGLCSTHGAGKKDEYAIDFNHYGSDNKPDDKNKTILAAASGVAKIYPGQNGGYGNYVLIFHGNGFVTRYAHLNEFLVNNNQWVWQGEPIGLCGNTGGNWGEHLHFVLYKDEKGYKPEPIDGETGIIHEDTRGFTSSNVNLYTKVSYIDFDAKCKNSVLRNPLVERFRNPATGKIEITQSPADNKIYYYKDILCNVVFYAAYNIIGNDPGGCLECGDASNPNTQPSTKDYIPDPARCELKLDADPFINGIEYHVQVGQITLPAGNVIDWRAELEMEHENAKDCRTPEAANNETVETDFFMRINGGSWQKKCHASTKFDNLTENNPHDEHCHINLPVEIGTKVEFKTITDVNRELTGTPSGGTESRIEEFEIVEGSNNSQTQSESTSDEAAAIMIILGN